MALAALVAGALTTRPWAFTEFSLLGYPATGTHSILPAEFYWVSTEFLFWERNAHQLVGLWSFVSKMEFHFDGGGL